MSNLSKLLGGGKKKGGDGTQKPKPPSVPPLVETPAARPADDAVTRQTDLSALAAQDEDAPTKEVVKPEEPKGAKVVPLGVGSKLKGQRPEPVMPSVFDDGPVESTPEAAPAEAVSQPAPEAPAAVAEEAKPAEAPSEDVLANAMRQFTEEVAKLLKPIEERVKKVEESLRTLTAKVDTKADAEELETLVMQIEGPEEGEEVVDENGDAVEFVGLNDQVATLSEELGTLRRQLLGENPDATLAEFTDGEGNLHAPVPTLYQAVMEQGEALDQLAGNEGERIPSIVDDNRHVTANLLVAMLNGGKLDRNDFEKLVIERGPETVREVLSSLKEDPQAVDSILSRLDADLAADADARGKKAATVSAKAGAAVAQVDWDSLIQRAAEYRKGGDE